MGPAVTLPQMELRALIKKLWPFRFLVLGGGLILMLAVYSVSLYLPVAYRASLGLYVNRRIQESSDKYYTFDGYYSQQAAERYTQTVVGFLQSRDVLKAAATSVLLPTDDTFLKRLSKDIRIREEAPQLISLTVTRNSREEAEKLNLNLARAVIEKLTVLNQTGDRSLTIEPVSSQPFLEILKPQPVLNGVLAFLAGIFLFSLVISFSAYLRE